MAMIDKYEIPFRPNYEAYAATAWGAGFLGSALGATLSELPTQPFLWLAVAAAGMAAKRTWQAMVQHEKCGSLDGKELEYMTIEELQAKMQQFPDGIWIGNGFDWAPKHAQLAADLRSTVLAVGQKQTKLGAAWLHTLEPQEFDLVIPIRDTAGHVLIVGTTGAGKTRLFDVLVTQAILRNEAVLIIDPKGDKELCENARRACVASGHPGRFVSFHPAFPKESCRIDPLRNFNRPTELASRIAALIPSETGADPFKSFGQMALNNIIQGLLMTGRRPTLVNIRSYLEGGIEELVVKSLSSFFETYIEDWEKAAAPYLTKAKTTEHKALGLLKYYRTEARTVKASPDLEGMLSMFEHDRAHFGKMIASLLPVLNMLTSGEMGPLLSPDPTDDTDDRPMTDTSRIINEGQVAYIGLDSLSDAMVGSAIGSIILSDLTAVAGDRYNYGTSLRPVNVFVDEAAEVINDPFIQLLNKGRGAMMRTIVATQTYADFVARTGSQAKADQVLGNINNTIALRITDTTTQERIVAGLPIIKLKSLQRGQGMSTGSGFDNPMAYSGSAQERLTEVDGDMFPSSLLGQLPNLEYVANASGGRFLKGRLPVIVSEKPKK